MQIKSPFTENGYTIGRQHVNGGGVRNACEKGYLKGINDFL